MNLYVFTLRADDGREFEFQSSASTLVEAETEADQRAARTGAALIRVTKSYVGEPVEAARSDREGGAV